MQAVFSIANGPLISYLPYYGASASPGSCDTVDMLENMSRADRESRARAWREFGSFIASGASIRTLFPCLKKPPSKFPAGRSFTGYSVIGMSPMSKFIL